MTTKQMESKLKKAYIEIENIYNDEDFIAKYSKHQVYAKMTDIIVTMGSTLSEMRCENA